MDLTERVAVTLLVGVWADLRLLGGLAGAD
jgi:hypothetical protein